MPTVQLLSILVFAISSNFDNVGVGIAYGIRGTCIPFASNLIIALISGTGTLLSMFVGTSLYRFLKPEVATVFPCLLFILQFCFVDYDVKGCVERGRSKSRF